MNKIPDWKLILKQIAQKGIVNNVPFIIYLSILAIIYISISHYAENTEREIVKIAKELKEQRWKYIDQKTQMMSMTKESSLETRANELGLKIAKTPPFKITINQNQSEN